LKPCRAVERTRVAASNALRATTWERQIRRILNVRSRGCVASAASGDGTLALSPTGLPIPHDVPVHHSDSEPAKQVYCTTCTALTDSRKVAGRPTWARPRARSTHSLAWWHWPALHVYHANRVFGRNPFSKFESTSRAGSPAVDEDSQTVLYGGPASALLFRVP
jgi:hypothetical protein